MANGDVRTACSRISIRMGPGKRAHLPVHETSIPHIGRYHRCLRPQLARAEEHHQAAISIADSTACRVAQRWFAIGTQTCCGPGMEWVIGLARVNFSAKQCLSTKPPKRHGTPGIPRTGFRICERYPLPKQLDQARLTPASSLSRLNASSPGRIARSNRRLEISILTHIVLIAAPFTLSSPPRNLACMIRAQSARAFIRVIRQDVWRPDATFDLRDLCHFYYIGL
jgi:hypothetical protein